MGNLDENLPIPPCEGPPSCEGSPVILFPVCHVSYAHSAQSQDSQARSLSTLFPFRFSSPQITKHVKFGAPGTHNTMKNKTMLTFFQSDYNNHDLPDAVFDVPEAPRTLNIALKRCTVFHNRSPTYYKQNIKFQTCSYQTRPLPPLGPHKAYKRRNDRKTNANLTKDTTKHT